MALPQVSQGATYSSLREILNSQDLADRIARYSEGDLTHIEYFHKIPANTPQDPRNLWLRRQNPTTGAVTVTSAAEGTWDLDVILTLPDSASPVNPGPGFLDIYVAMAIGHRAQTVTSAMSKPWGGASRTFTRPSPTSWGASRQWAPTSTKRTSTG